MPARDKAKVVQGGCAAGNVADRLEVLVRLGQEGAGNFVVAAILRDNPEALQLLDAFLRRVEPREEA